MTYSFDLVPLALLVVGGMHFMREKLPVHLQSGFRKFLFQGMVVSGAVMFSNILFPSTCFDKVKPKLLEFHQRVCFLFKKPIITYKYNYF